MRNYTGYIEEALRLAAQPVRELVLEALGSPPPNLNLRDPYYLFKWALNNWEDRFVPALVKKYGLDEPTSRRVRTLLFSLKDARNAWAHLDPWRDREEWVRHVLLSAAQLMDLLGKEEEAGALLEMEKRVLTQTSSLSPNEGAADLPEELSPDQALKVFTKALEARLNAHDFLRPTFSEPYKTSWTEELLNWLCRSLDGDGISSLLQQPDERKAYWIAWTFVELLGDYYLLEGLTWSHVTDGLFMHLEDLYQLLNKEELTDSWATQVSHFAAYLGASLVEAELAMALYVIPFSDGWRRSYYEDQRAQQLLKRKWDLIEAFRQKNPELDTNQVINVLEKDPEFLKIDKELQELWEQSKEKLRQERLARVHELLEADPEEIPRILGMENEEHRGPWWARTLEEKP